MRTSNNNSIISKFITKEVEMTYRRYSEIPEEEISTVAEFIEKVEENKIEFYPYLNYKATKTLAEICKDIEDADFISFYIFLRCDISLDVNIEEAKAAYYRLEDFGYVESHCYYIYYKNRENVMKELAKDEVLNKLEDSYEVSAMFSDDELADMWIQGISKENVAKEYMSDRNWQDILEVGESIEGYTDSTGNEIYYCYAGREV